jgi:hypothetical protein
MQEKPSILFFDKAISFSFHQFAANRTPSARLDPDPAAPILPVMCTARMMFLAGIDFTALQLVI